MDAKALAQKLGVTPKTIGVWAKTLGIRGTAVKAEGQTGRPSIVYSPQECEQIAQHGRPQNPVTDSGFTEDEGIQAGAVVLRETIAAPLALGFSQIASQLEAIEDQAASALTARVSQMPQRILGKVARNLKGYEALNLGDVFGVINAPSLPTSTIEVNLGSLPASKVS